MGKIVGGWQVNTVGTLRGGFTSDIRTSVLPGPIFNTFNVADRIAGQSMVVNNWSVDSYFNPGAFAVPGTLPSASQALRFPESFGNFCPEGSSWTGVEERGCFDFQEYRFPRTLPRAIPRRILQPDEYADVLSSIREQSDADVHRISRRGVQCQ